MGLITNVDLPFEIVWGATTAAVAVDGTGTAPANLGGFVLQNSSAAARYVRFFNGQPTMGTSKAAIVIALQGNQTLAHSFMRPPVFSAGLWVSVTTGQGDTNNSAPASGDVLINAFYQE